jgi:hopanoid-associated phosphorylase
MIVVVGLAFEARIAAGPGVRVICSGDGRNLANSLATALRSASGCGGLVSFGVAGGLHPDLRPGDCIVASAVLCGANRLPTDRRWSRNLIRTVPGAMLGVLAGAAAPVATPEAKRLLHQRTGAFAVDMESHIVASVAAKHAIPMAAIRVITDPAMRALPKSAIGAMRADGTTDIPAMLHLLVRNPWELPRMLRTAFDARAARATLRRGRRLLGPSLGLPKVRPLGLDVA